MLFSATSTRKTGLALAVLGLALLIAVLPEEKTILIEDISKEAAGEKVAITGVIRELSFSKGNAFFSLENKANIRAVYFQPDARQAAELREGRIVKARGRVAVYNGELELIVEEAKEVD